MFQTSLLACNGRERPALKRALWVLVQESNGAARSLYEALGYQRVWTRNVPAARISQVCLPPSRPPSRPPPYHASGEMRHFDRQCRVGVPPEGLSCPQLKLAGGEKKIAPGGARPRRRPRRAQRSPPATSVRQLVAPLVKDGCLSVCLSSVAVAIRGHQACQAPSCSSCCCCRRRRRRT